MRTCVLLNQYRNYIQHGRLSEDSTEELQVEFVK
jgi:hypothetical protein